MLPRSCFTGVAMAFLLLLALGTLLAVCGRARAELAPRSIALPLFLPAALPCRARAAYVRCARRASYVHALPKPHCPLARPCSDVLALSLRSAPSLSSVALSFARPAAMATELASTMASLLRLLSLLSLSCFALTSVP